MAADQPPPGPPSSVSPTSRRTPLSAPAPTTDSPTGAPVRSGTGARNRLRLPPSLRAKAAWLRPTALAMASVQRQASPPLPGAQTSDRAIMHRPGSHPLRPSERQNHDRCRILRQRRVHDADGLDRGGHSRRDPKSTPADEPRLRPASPRSTAAWATPKRDPGARCRPRARAPTARSAAALPRFGMAQAARSPPSGTRASPSAPMCSSGAKNLTSIRTLD